MHTTWTDQLSEYLDDQLAPEARAALESHLAACADCRDVLADLRLVTAAAATLEPTPPAADLWPGIAERIGVASSVVPLRARRWRLPAALAAGLGLVAVGAGGAWLALRSPAAGDPVAAAAPATVTGVLVRGDGRSADAAVAELEALLAQEAGRLDSATVRVIAENLAIIDRAIADAERALAADSANPYVRRHLAATTRRKVALLQTAAALAAAAQS